MTITSVWSAYGHRFITDGEAHPHGGGTESCLTCGALYELVAEEGDPTSGSYVAANGDEPMQCSGDTSMSHGYPGERPCGDCPEPGCAHCCHDCNCLSCA